MSDAYPPLPPALRERFSDEELADIEKQFRVFDRDGNGRIDRGEIDRVLRAAGVVASGDVIDSMLGDFDKDESGTIEFWEYVTAVAKIMKR